MEAKRTIQEVLHLETGRLVSASVIFRRSFDELVLLRSELEKANQGLREKLIVCSVCGQKLRLLGGKSQDTLARSKNFYFAHLHSSGDCPIKTTSRYSKEDINRMKYRGATESFLHIDLKNKIAASLLENHRTKEQISFVQQERVVRSLDEAEWKKPDISSSFMGKRMAIELQLSTTWLDVITARQHFYKQAKIFILWIFNIFEKDNDFRNLTKSDIVFTNNNNAFVFDAETYEKSLAGKDLVLRCYYLKFYSSFEKLKERWESKLVTLEELQFNEETYQVYYYDSLTSKANALAEIQDYKEMIEEKERQEQIAYESKLQEKRDLEALISVSKDKRESLTQLVKTFEKDLRDLSENIERVNSKIEDCEENVKDLYLRLDRLSGYGIPKEAWDKILDYQTQFKQFLEGIRKIEQEKKDLRSRIANIENLPTLNIGGIEYRKMNKQLHWDYIINNSDILYLFRLGQKDDLFNKPSVSRLVRNQLELLRYNEQVEILADFSSRLGELKTTLKESERQTSEISQQQAFLKEKFEAEVKQAFISCYSNECYEYRVKTKDLKDQLREAENLLTKERQKLKNLQKDYESFRYFYED